MEDRPGVRTMMVCMKDGKLVNREVDRVDISADSLRGGDERGRVVPKLLDGEEVLYTLGDRTPTIVDTGRGRMIPLEGPCFYCPEDGS